MQAGAGGGGGRSQTSTASLSSDHHHAPPHPRGTAAATAMTTDESAAGGDVEEEELLVLVDLPEYAGVNIFETAETIEIKNIEGPMPELIVNGKKTFRGHYADPLGTTLIVDDTPLPEEEDADRPSILSMATKLLTFHETSKGEGLSELSGTAAAAAGKKRGEKAAGGERVADHDEKEYDEEDEEEEDGGEGGEEGVEEGMDEE